MFDINVVLNGVLFWVVIAFVVAIAQYQDLVVMTRQVCVDSLLWPWHVLLFARDSLKEFFADCWDINPFAIRDPHEELAGVPNNYFQQDDQLTQTPVCGFLSKWGAVSESDPNKLTVLERIQLGREYFRGFELDYVDPANDHDVGVLRNALDFYGVPTHRDELSPAQRRTLDEPEAEAA